MKKLISKQDIRADLEEEMQRFLSQGGNVENIPRGKSGKDPLDAPMFLNRRLFIEPRAERTLVPEVVAAIEERRKAMLKRTPQRKRSRLPKTRKKTIYDDFGEPLRRVWTED
ncbi:MAG: hypothetical protein ACJAYC_000529 [Halieaceae bacterium]